MDECQAHSSYRLSHQYLDNEFPVRYRENLIHNSWNEEIFMLETLHKLFDTGNYKGNLMVEVGCGPTVHRLASASRFYTNVITSDYTQANRESVQNWLDENALAFDWSPFFRVVSELEGYSDIEEGMKQIERRIRRTVKEVVHCDLLHENPLPSHIEEIDLLLTAYCVESVSNTTEAFVTAVKRLGERIRHGGTLIMLTTIGMSSAVLNGKRIMVLEVSEEFVSRSFAEAGFVQTSWHMLENIGNDKIGEFKGVSLICGTKT